MRVKCCVCGKIKLKDKSWALIKTDDAISHSYCPECYINEMAKINNQKSIYQQWKASGKSAAEFYRDMKRGKEEEDEPTLLVKIARAKRRAGNK